uniref:C-terminal binding protein n=1 Tax=Marchantia polymorpha TaxID=3197 RepID=Q7XAP0_MARPO|nr:C-terminal binding protein [Marchantia polymorpha]
MGKGVTMPPEASSGRVDGGRVAERNPGSRQIGKMRSDGTVRKSKGYEPLSMGLPLVVALNCMDDCRAEAEALEGVAVVEHVGLAQVGEGKIEAAVAVLVQSLAYLPRAAQRRLQPWQLILSLGCADKAVDSGLASDLGLQLLHVDSGRSEEVADTAMALILGLLRRTPALAAQAGASAGWLGALPAACRGMRRCRGQVLGIIGTSASACALATRCLSFKMRVIYLDTEEERDGDRRHRRAFPPLVKKSENLKELLSLSDVVSLHCPLTNETVQIINAETIKYIKPGALLVNTSSSHLLDDCALKEALIEGTLAGCALDGVEGPQWLEAWVREMPNVLILPKSADYSEEVWAEIRAKAVSVLRSFLLEGVVPANAASDDEDSQRDSLWQDDRQEKIDKEGITRIKDGEQRSGESQTAQDFRHKQMYFQSQDQRVHSQEVDLSHGLVQRDSRNNHVKGSGKKGKKRAGRRKAQQQPSGTSIASERDATWLTLQREDRGNGTSSKDAVVNSNSRFGSPEESKIKRETDGTLGVETIVESSQEVQKVAVKGTNQGAALDYLKEGQIVALRARADGGYYVARQKGPGRGWRLDTMVDVTCRDPRAQFLVVVRNRDRIGLRSLAAGGKLLQANKKLELVFVNHTFDVWESWIVEGSTLEDCTLTNSKFRGVSLDVSIEILAAVGEEDGVVRWLS